MTSSMATKSSQTASRQAVTDESHRCFHQLKQHLDHPPVEKHGERSGQSHWGSQMSRLVMNDQRTYFGTPLVNDFLMLS